MVAVHHWELMLRVAELSRERRGHAYRRTLDAHDHRVSGAKCTASRDRGSMTLAHCISTSLATGVPGEVCWPRMGGRSN